MREILFRAKQTPNSEWIEGSLIIGNNYNFIITNEDYQDVVATQSALVCESHMIAKDNKTLGQYTGLTDKNGKKIFEGDIIKFNVETLTHMSYIVGVVKYYNASYGIAYENDRHFLAFSNASLYVRWYEVIGNIYDNIESLEVE